MKLGEIPIRVLSIVKDVLKLMGAITEDQLIDPAIPILQLLGSLIEELNNRVHY